MELDPRLRAAIDEIRPEARTLVEVALADPTTKDGYGRVMANLAPMPRQYAQLVLVAMTAEGYPVDTAQQVAEFLGL